MRVLARGGWAALAASFLIVAISIVIVWRDTIGSLNSIGWSVYGYSEWLINYSGGFVRRGLAGEIIAWLAGGDSALRIATDLVFALYVALALLFLCLALMSARSRAGAILLSIVIPGGIAAMARDNGFYFRKEILFLVVLQVACLLFMAMHRATTRFAQQVMLVSLLLVVFAGALVLPFVHEGYVFYGAPAVFILLLYLTRAFPEKAYLKFLLLLYPLLPIGGFMIAWFFKGNEATAIAIWHSLAQSDRLLMAPAAPWKPFGAIMTIGYTVLNGLAHSAIIVLEGGFWFWALIAACVFLLLTVFTCLLYGEEDRASEAAASLSVLPLLFIGVLPVFVVTSDWGRIIASVSLSYLVLAYALKGRVLPPIVPGMAAPLLLLVRAVGRRPRISFWFALVFSLTFSYPECCLNPGLGANPFASIYPAVRSAYHALTPGAEWTDRIKGDGTAKPARRQ